MKTNIPESLIDELRGKDKTFVVTLEEELPRGSVLSETLYTGLGTIRTLSALYQWYDRKKYALDPVEHVLIHLGSACSSRYSVGTVLRAGSVTLWGSERVEDRIGLDDASARAGASLLTCNWLPTASMVNPVETQRLLAEYDLFDTEAYAIARFCQETGLRLVCIKGVTESLKEDTTADWRKGLKDLQRSFCRLAKMIQ